MTSQQLLMHHDGTHQVHNLKELITTMQLSPKHHPVLLVGPKKQEQIEWLTALITHVFNTERNACILITTPNNLSADTLSLGLLRFVPSESLVRIVSNRALLRRRRKRHIDEINVLEEISMHRDDLDSVFGRRIVLCTTSMAVNQQISGKHEQFTNTLIADCAESLQTLELIGKIWKPNSIGNMCGQLWLTSEFWPPLHQSNKALVDLPKFVTYCTFRTEYNEPDSASRRVNLKRRAEVDQPESNYGKRRELYFPNPMPIDADQYEPVLYNHNSMAFGQQPNYMEHTFLDLPSITYKTKTSDAFFNNPLDSWGTEYRGTEHKYQPDIPTAPPSAPFISAEDFAELKFMLMISSKVNAQEDQRIPKQAFGSSKHALPTVKLFHPVDTPYSDIDFNLLITPRCIYENDEQNLALYSEDDLSAHNPQKTINNTIITTVLPNKSPQFICGPLPEFPPSPIIDRLTKLKYEFSDHMTSEEMLTLQKIRDFQGFLGPIDYVAMMRIIIGVEDCFVQNDRTRHDRPNRQAVVTDGASMNPYFCSITSDSVPAFVMAGDKVLLSIESSDAENSAEAILGEVRAVCESTLDLELSLPMKSDAKYTMHFALNRLNFRLEQFAMQNVHDLQLTKYLFPETHPIYLRSDLNFKFYNQQLANEIQQRRAVEDIVAGQFYPCPYILAGCAGSGKTDIIVESIIQLYNASPNNRVLVCSPSNGVLDEITVRLASWSGDVRSDCLRLFASSTENNVDKGSTLYKVSNFSQGGKNSYIFVADLIRRSRVVLSTLAVSGRIALTNLEKSFFTHIFIDECHASGEAMTLVPIASICSSLDRINARVVLVGDPHQMGPVVKSPWAKRLNYGRSLMARLLQLPIYQQNCRLSTTLCANYRSHSRIVQVASTLFYGHRMTPNACLRKTTTMFPDIQFPIKFDNVNGKPSKGTSCDSWYNMAEVHHVISLVVYLVQVNRVRLDDIGIISPYRRQIMKIINQLGAWRHRIKVGSVEQFQGVERHIIIVSTVRTKNLGFVTDPGRINVILTRAISILVVVGNASSLEKQSGEWAKVIEMCRQNGTLCQV